MITAKAVREVRQETESFLHDYYGEYGTRKTPVKLLPQQTLSRMLLKLMDLFAEHLDDCSGR